MIRYFYMALFFSATYLGCCSVFQTEALESDLSGFVGKSYTGKMKTPDGKIIEFELQITRDKKLDDYAANRGGVAYAASCPKAYLGVKGVLKSTDVSSLHIPISGRIARFGEREFKLHPEEHSARYPVCHSLYLTVDKETQFVDGSYKHNPECGEATLKEAVITELKPK